MDKNTESEERYRFEKLTQRLSLPRDLVYGECLITMTGNRELLIENYRSICLFEDNCIIVALKHQKLCISGRHLEILYYREDELRIKGIIDQIQFLRERGR